MARVVFLIGFLAARYALGADAASDAPNYTADSIVNAADNRSKLAPNTIATVYGLNLEFSTLGTSVLVGGLPADLFYVSTLQINFLVPANLDAVQVPVYVVVDGLRGPIIQVTLAPAAPALFQTDVQIDGQNIQAAIATHLDDTLLAPSSPAHPGEIVVLWANGLGATLPSAVYGPAASLVPGADLQILLNGVAVDPTAIEYAGLAPGYAGLYQINLILPKSVGPNPEIQLVMGDASSISGVHLLVGP